MHSQTFYGKRLAQARLWHNYSQDYLAGMLNITKASISLYEKDLRIPKDNIILEIASKLNFPPRFFFSKPEENNHTPLSFRKKSITLKSSLDKALAYQQFALRLFNELSNYVDFISNEFGFYNDDPLSLNNKIIENLTTDTRAAYKLDPIHDLTVFIENRGVIIINADLKSLSIDGFSCVTNGIPFIFINSDQSWDRYRFTLAHELGHIILHSSLTDEMWSNKETRKIVEKQANYFASALLLPQESFKKDFLGISDNALLFIKKKWGLSLAAIVYRASELGLISEETKIYYFKHINTKGQRIQEKGSDFRQRESPFILKNALHDITEDTFISKQMLIEDIALPKNIIQQFIEDIAIDEAVPKRVFTIIKAEIDKKI